MPAAIPPPIHLHQALDIGPGEVIEVVLDHPANVLLMDDENYAHYCQYRTYHYHGGHATFSPFPLTPPRPGTWLLVVDLGGGFGRVRAYARIFQGQMIDVEKRL